LSKYPEIQLEYLAVCSFLDLEPLSTFDSASGASIIIAAIVQGVRLIDNIIVPPQA
jgi:pantothenate synthetase